MDRGAWQATVQGGHKEAEMTKQQLHSQKRPRTRKMLFSTYYHPVSEQQLKCTVLTWSFHFLAVWHG